MKRVRIILDPTLPMGKYRIGGARVVHIEDDAALGRELRTVQIACHAENDAAYIREVVANDDDLELAGPEYSAEPDTREAVSADDLQDAIG
jgi:hypothetical protein